MVLATNLGFPRIGPRRELKRALEDFWAGKSEEADVLATARTLRQQNWQLQKELGLSHIPSNDFALYDHVLDTAAMLGAVPGRYGWSGDSVDLDTYFAMARGVQEGRKSKQEVAAMEMTKWFDTNYHYIVPEFERGQAFKFASTKPVDHFKEAKLLGIHTRPVLVGPVSFLLLGKARDEGLEPLSLLEGVLPIYEQVVKLLAAEGADWVQMDEPYLALDLDDRQRTAFGIAYQRLAAADPRIKLLVTTYFDGLRENLQTAASLPVAALHVDLVRAPEQLDSTLRALPDQMSLSIGVVDGRNVWRTDLERALTQVERAIAAVGSERVMIAPSCSLLHSPIDLDQETRLDEELREWMAFSKQKVMEIEILARAAGQGRSAVASELEANRSAMQRRRSSTRIHNPAVKQRAASVTDEMLRRTSAYPERRRVQQERLNLPTFPTTTIGSFPQTREVRAARAEFRAKKQDLATYEAFLRQEIELCVRFQEEIELDVLVHGEFERNDMVEYFGEQLRGYVFTQQGWVQSYGSRYVKPPIIYGDVNRPSAMTVRWSTFAQTVTKKPMKGMLTGPVTMLQWSFVRDDQPRSETCKQIALALRDEVIDLEGAGIKVIQIDEPALREGLPLRRADWQAYLRWAVDAFRLSSAGVRDETQIHSHMCYAEFNDIIEAIGAMDADAISIESSRSDMELLGAFTRYRYPNEIGPGVYDIHSPRVPSREEMAELLRKGLNVLSTEQLWVNPDCGLKTRRWEEVRPALANMVAAAQELRESVLAKA